MRFCCKKMNESIYKYNLIEFEEHVRAYNLPVSPNGIRLKLCFCPFCGNDLGKRLNAEYYDILYKEFEIEHPETIESNKVPLEFKTDEWWRKRGL
jgi:hypothetical protein